MAERKKVIAVTAIEKVTVGERKKVTAEVQNVKEVLEADLKKKVAQVLGAQDAAKNLKRKVSIVQVLVNQGRGRNSKNFLGLPQRHKDSK